MGRRGFSLLMASDGPPGGFMRTDRCGAIHVFTGGQKLEVSCFLGCRDISSRPVHVQSQRPDSQEKNE